MNSCFDKQTLVRIGRGDTVSDVDLERLATHLAECKQCADRYLNVIRGGLPSRSTNDEIVSPVSPDLMTGSNDDEFWPPPAVLTANPKWEILDLLGAGGMGVVYLARDRINQKQLVALKVLHPRVAETIVFLKRFKREAMLLQEIEPHPNVVGFVSADQAGDLEMLAMEFIPGRSMYAYQSEFPARRVPIQTAVDLALQTLAGLEHVWQSVRLVHRDISPANLLVDWQGSLSILDFGLAKSREPDLAHGVSTHPQLGGGTSYYCAPEQDLNLGNVDFRADLYGFACTLFEILTGEPVFGVRSGHSTDLAIRLAHHTASPRLAADVCSDVPLELGEAIDRLLSKEPERRFASFAEVAARLLPFADNRSLAWVRDTHAHWIASPETIPKPLVTHSTSTKHQGVFFRLLPWSLFGLCATGLLGYYFFLSWGIDDSTRPAMVGNNSESSQTATLVRSSGRWQIEGGTLCHYDGDGEQWLLFGDPSWTNYRFRFKARHLGFPSGLSALFRSPSDDEITLFSFGWIDFRTAQIRYRKGNDFFVEHQSDEQPYFKQLEWSIEADRWYEIETEVVDSNATCSVDGLPIFDVRDIPFSQGRVGIRFWRTWKGKSEFRDFEVIDVNRDVLWSGLPELPTRENLP
jgi:serine/threonine protein kinase